jgi:Mrp family chromosome partitioning ATPase
MRAREELFDPMDSVLESFIPEENAWTRKWRLVRDGSVPSIKPALAPSESVRDVARDAMLQLVQRIFLAPGSIAPRKVMFCGIDKNNSTSVCAEAGRVLAEQTGSTVCLVDANVRDYRLTKHFSLDQTKSTFGRLAPWREQCVYVGKNLFVAGTGVLGGVHGGLAPSSELKDRLIALSSSFEYLLFDAPGINTCADASLLGQVAGSVVLVLDANATRKVDARRAKENLELAHARVLGAVLRNHA